MTKLDDLFDPADLAVAIEAGHVRTQTHPTLPYVIYNYAEKAVFEQAWTPVTRQCRGLIVDLNTGLVLARPFPKFFNHDEPSAPVVPLDAAVRVTDKIDGSLGILYPTDNGYAVSTRGSFASDQAIHATALYQRVYADQFMPEPGWTYLFEIVYPENRIVVDYGTQDDLVLLGAVRIGTGETVLDDIDDWPGPRTTTFNFPTFADALGAEPRDGQEGLVVEHISTGERVKLKQDEYVRLHRIVTGLNARVVWENLGSDQPLSALIEPLPDEFHPWVHQVACELDGRIVDILARVDERHSQIVDTLPAGWTRKDYAMVAKDDPDRGYLFRTLDGKSCWEMAWKAVYPDARWTPSGRTYDEAAA